MIRSRKTSRLSVSTLSFYFEGLVFMDWFLQTAEAEGAFDPGRASHREDLLDSAVSEAFECKT